MSKRSLDWRFLGDTMLLPGVTLAVSVLVLAVSFWFHGTHEGQYSEYSINQRNMNDDYDALILRKRILESYHQRYDQFQKTGFVGRENRLDWVETIRTAAADLDLPHVTYSLEPQVEVVPPVSSPHTNEMLQVRASSVQVDIGLVHELDLLRFFDHLRSEAPGLMKVDECSMRRQNGGDPRLTGEANIVANCKLMVFSVVTSDILETEAES